MYVCIHMQLAILTAHILLHTTYGSRFGNFIVKICCVALNKTCKMFNNLHMKRFVLPKVYHMYISKLYIALVFTRVSTILNSSHISKPRDEDGGRT